MTADLDQFREAVGSLYLGGSHVGYLATTVEQMRAGVLLRRQPRVWLLLTRLDGTLDIQEDYAPWVSVSELREGHINWSPNWSAHGDDVDYEVRWLTGEARHSAWLLYGLVEDVGKYIARAARLHRTGCATVGAAGRSQAG